MLDYSHENGLDIPTYRTKKPKMQLSNLDVKKCHGPEGAQSNNDCREAQKCPCPLSLNKPLPYSLSLTRLTGWTASI